MMRFFNGYRERVVEREPASRQVRSAQEVLFQTLDRMMSDPNARRTPHMLHNADCFWEHLVNLRRSDPSNNSPETNHNEAQSNNFSHLHKVLEELPRPVNDLRAELCRRYHEGGTNNCLIIIAVILCSRCCLQTLVQFLESGCRESHKSQSLASR